MTDTKVKGDDQPRVPGKTPVSILVVDDNDSKRLALKAVLAPLGYEIVEADCGEAALRCVMVRDFAVILLDVRMPLIDGFETAALIRQRRQSEMTPIIFITAYAIDEIDERERYVQGAVDFMFAPVHPDELRAKVSVFVNLFMKAEVLAARAQAVQTSADQLRLLTEAAPIGIFQTDTDNRYVYTNPLWTEITGMPPEVAVGQHWDIILDSKQRADLIAEQAGDTLHRAGLCHRFEIGPPGAARRVVLVSSRFIPDTEGGKAGWVGTLADVTTEVRAETAMADARDEATGASQLKSNFLANMSHEIRTPMNGIIGMTELLLETGLDARQRDYAETVRNSGEALVTIISDILDFSKIEAGMLELEDIEYNQRTVVDDVVDLLTGQAQAKGLELVASIESSIPAMVNGDPGRVRQVLTNLLGNAIKFTQAGNVIVRVSEAEPVDADIRLRFEVSDTGDGIAPDKLDTIFEPFVQADNSTSRKYGGSGLGLTISAQLVSLLGGECGVTSRLGIGSNFWFTVCVRAVDGQATNLPTSPGMSLAGVPALIVDDNVAQRSALSEYLTYWGMKVSTADSGRAGLSALCTAANGDEPFAVALIDRSMPGMDGLELLNLVKEEPAVTAGLLLMTGLGQEGDLRDNAESGAFEILSKPVRRDALQLCLQNVLGMNVTKGPDTDLMTPSSRGDSEGGRLLLVEDNLVNQKVAVAMLSGSGYRVDTVRDGIAAVEAVATQPYDAVLMDCQMPVMNGYEATAAIRTQEGSGRHIPIIAMTAEARSEDQQRCLAAGMDSYLSKPVSKQNLLSMVARSIRMARLASSAGRSKTYG